MLPYDPDSTSEILRARYILLAVIDSISFGEWEPDQPMLERCTGNARIRIERLLKGEIATAPDRVFTVEVTIWRNAGPRFVAVPGVWSECGIGAGAAFVVFSSACRADPAALLTEPCAFAVRPAGSALSEVELISELATPETRLPALVAALAARRDSLTVLSARYVAARLRELLFSDPSGFHSILSEVENPAAKTDFRRIVISEAYDDLMMLDPAVPTFIARLIWGSVRMFGSGTAPEFAGRVLETYIPNLLGIEGGLSKKRARDVFEHAQKSRQETETILRNRTELPGRERILTWLAT
jgi:hypothetical protein